ncbi:MAG: hypothetical protein QXZ31_07970, partial [Thermofilaceae archaeon]
MPGRLMSRVSSPQRLRCTCGLMVLAITALALASVRTVLVGGEVAGWDHSFHFTNAYLTYFFFMADGHPIGYDPWHMYGWPPNLYYNPGTTLFVAFTHSILSPLLDMKSTYSLCVALSYALMAPAAATLAHALTGSPLAAATAALVAVTVFDEENSWTDAGWRQVYYIGMWPQRWGIVTGLASIALLVYAARRRGFEALPLLAASSLLMAWSTLAHVMMGVATAVSAAVFTLFEAFRAISRRSYRDGGRVIALSALWLLWSLALLAFWLVPLLETNEKYHGLRTLTWEVGPGIVFTILASYPAYLNVLALIGPLLITVKRRKPIPWILYAAWVALTAAAVASAGGALPREAMGTFTLLSLCSALPLYSQSGSEGSLIMLPTLALLLLWLATGPRTYVILLPGAKLSFENLPVIEWFGYGKFAGYARYILLISFSATAAAFISKAAEWVHRNPAQDRWVAALAVASLAVAGLYLPALSGMLRNTDLITHSKKFRFIEEFPLYSNVSDFISALSILGLSSNTYLLVQDLSDNFADWVIFCHNHFVYEFPLYLGVPIVGGIVWTRYVTQPISTTEYSRLFTVDIGYWAQNVETFHRMLSELGISYVATFDWRLKEALRSSPLFEEVVSVPPYTLFRTRSFHPLITVEGAEVRDVVIRPNLIRFTLKAHPLQEYEVRVRLIRFPGLTVTTYPEAVSIAISSYNPWVADEVSRAWGYRVESRIPFIKLTLVPLADETVVEIRYRPGSWGDSVSLVAVLAASLALLQPILAYLHAFARFKL